MTKPTVLALDPGIKNTGFAFRGESTLIEETGTLNIEPQKIMTPLQKLIDNLSPGVIVIGIPDRGYVTDISKNIKVEIERANNIPVFLVEETNSSKIALRSLIASNQSQTNRAKKLHASSAAVILEEYENLYED